MAELDRREVLKAATAALLGVPLAMAQSQAVKVAELSKLAKEWEAVEFGFGTNKAVLVRIPKPSKEDKRVLEAKLGSATVYMVAHLRVCTHQGCTPPLPDANHQMVCPCHESTFKAEDGSVVSGPAKLPLKGIKLELRGGEVWATGLIE